MRRKHKEEEGSTALLDREGNAKDETQEAKEAEARRKQQDVHMEEELEAHLEPIRARFRDQYRDFRASAGHPQKVPAAPHGQSTGHCVECGELTAMGQNYVCRKHIRMG